MQHFKSEGDALAYIKAELLATLGDDLERMEGRESQHCEDSDRAEMRNRIADLESIMPRLQIVESQYAAGYEAQGAGFKWWNNPHPSGSVSSYEWDNGHSAARRDRMNP